MTKLVAYVCKNYTRELDEVKNSEIANVFSDLSIEERTIIYKYTEDGYAGLNETLRHTTGKEITEFGRFLDKTISKLPDYVGITYRCVDLTDHELQKYFNAKTNNTILVEHSFISASKSKFIAYEYGRNCQFRIISKTGKEIEAFAKYGSHHPQNEKEILFHPNCKFKVLEITKNDQQTLITSEEVS